MVAKSGLSVRFLVGCSLAALVAAGGAMAQEAPIVQPGAPGQAARALTPEEAVAIADNRFSADDVRFMRDMIVHHGQAVQMAALVADRTNRQALIDVAGRIDASQADEIAFMRTWLAQRGQDAADPHAAHGQHTMQGMATPAQLEALAAASGPAFDRLFLELMIAHHEGALTMADEVRKNGVDIRVQEIADDVTAEQADEIRRMRAWLGS